MITLPTGALALAGQEIWQAGLVFLRVAALVSLLPAFGEQSVPMRIKLALALVFTAIVAPAVPTIVPPETPTAFAWVVITETVAGLALGLGLRLFVLALQTAGSIAAQSTSLSQILGGAGIDPMPAMGYLLVIAGLALAVTAGLHVRAAELIILSYGPFPPGRLPDPVDLTGWGVEQIARTFALAFSLAAPFAIASTIYNLALGAINRAMPQLMVAFVGAPVITLGGLFLLFATAPLLLPVWVDALIAFAENPLGTGR